MKDRKGGPDQVDHGWGKREIMLAVRATDSQLLDHFVRDHDPGAFRSLVTRHGPAVLQVCRAVLQDAHEADDAFQATFLVLVRKAPTIQNPESLGGWLRGVAYRTATRARCRAARRRAIERNCAELARNEHVADELTPELRELVGEELDRLPDTYRLPVTLCYLQGLTHLEAAHRLGWPVGTVKVRLVRARRLLRERLDRRGVGLGVSSLLLWLQVSKISPASEPLRQSAVGAKKLAETGRLASLKAQLGRAMEIAQAALGIGLSLKIQSLWVVIALAGLFLGLTGPAVLAFHGSPVQEIDPTTLPANLTDVLSVECR
jgi:RNA polymerase sigma factor (sigma-70 family)